MALQMLRPAVARRSLRLLELLLLDSVTGYPVQVTDIDELGFMHVARALDL